MGNSLGSTSTQKAHVNHKVVCYYSISISTKKSKPMADIHTSYIYFLTLGSGEITIRLHFLDDGKARIHYISHWMGSDRQEYFLTCLHQPITPYQGFIRVTQIEDSMHTILYGESFEHYGDDTYGLNILDEERSTYNLLYEYIELPDPAWHFSGDMVLDSIRLTTEASWNDTFTLMLFTLDLTTYPEHEAIKQIIAKTSRAKFIKEGDTRLPLERG
jgi:hypothetical protein